MLKTRVLVIPAEYKTPGAITAPGFLSSLSSFATCTAPAFTQLSRREMVIAQEKRLILPAAASFPGPVASLPSYDCFRLVVFGFYIRKMLDKGDKIVV